ncbi:hypothetical protein BD289DRAFT_448016 [Coniella lustricola]|uniref:Rhodopsin domain-containing protein n=1 Tax=Coniella lustricola TaxID=2025994 RepID=A0A2T2ZSH9_9PEZI|nr:hypothetical protein BD289DRAFT_448016 [Coniella lustricola]
MAVSDNLSQRAFDGLNWLFFSLSLVALAARLYIRVTVFRRLIAEDYLMLATLCLLVADEALGQRFSSTIYYFMGVSSGTTPFPATVDALVKFLNEAGAMLKALGSAIIFFIAALFVIKANFMLFFRRLGHRTSNLFMPLWWAAFAVVMACGVVSLCMGVTTFRCLFNGLSYTLTQCETSAEQNRYFTYFRVTVALDIITDAIIIAFPIWILWGVRITTRKKVALGAIFSLVGLTIVATILRGAILTSVFEQSAAGSTINIPWIWFWFHIELCISVIVACLVSFRSLFMHNREQASSAAARRAAAMRRRSGYNQYIGPSGGGGVGGNANSSQRTPRQSGNASRRNLAGGLYYGRGSGGLGVGARHGGAGMRDQWKFLQDSVFDACRTLEGVDVDVDGSTLVDERELTEQSPVTRTGGGDGGGGGGGAGGLQHQQQQRQEHVDLEAALDHRHGHAQAHSATNREGGHAAQDSVDSTLGSRGGIAVDGGEGLGRSPSIDSLLVVDVDENENDQAQEHRIEDREPPRGHVRQSGGGGGDGGGRGSVRRSQRRDSQQRRITFRRMGRSMANEEEEGGGGGGGGTLRRQLSIDSLYRPSSELTVSSVSTSDERRPPSRE